MRHNIKYGTVLATALLLIIGLLQACDKDKLTVGDSIRDAAVSSDNIVMSSDGNTVYTANGDADTVTVFDAVSGKVATEIPVGREPDYISLSPDDRYLFVTCRYANEVQVIDARKREVIRSVQVGLEPMGVLASADGQTLYLANYRGSAITVLDVRTMKEIRTIRTSDGPLGLALAKDGEKLYVTHFPAGKISVVDAQAGKVSKEIDLAASPDRTDRKKSQGIPNSIGKLTISPDGQTAWAAHLLTNVDTPIQFEETIFPAFSVLNLKNDTEVTDARKQLFEEMNVKDAANETIIVSDPADLVFAPDGSKAFALFAGSEDLMIFDLKRGGNAVQALRRVPGDHPAGMAISPDGERLFVHNTMSHELSLIDTGGGKAYAQAKVTGGSIPLIGKDPLPTIVRKGKTIFYSANTDEYPIIGNNWMSCASCHAGGEMNGLTFMTPKGPRNTPSNVLALETGLMMWDGSRDDFADYILTVQNEMGGLADIDPGKPLSAEDQALFDALEAYLKEESSFPVPSNPYRNADGSLTDAAQRGQQLFEGKAGCIKCHAGEPLTDSIKAVSDSGKLSADNITYLHDVGTGTAADLPSEGDARADYANRRSGREFDTPTLRGIWATKPYLHDGSAPTLYDVLVTRNRENRHGHTADLTDKEIDDLIAFLQSMK